MTEQNRPSDGAADGTGPTEGTGSSPWAPPQQGSTPQPPAYGGGRHETERFAAPQPGFGQHAPQPAAPFPGQQPGSSFPGQQPGSFGPPQPGPAPHQGWPPAGWGAPAGQHPGQQGQPFGAQPGSVPPAFGVPAAEQPARPADRAGRWKLGIAGLVAGALIGGGAGAGVAALGDDGGSVTASGATSAQNVVIKDPQNATTATAAAGKAAPSVVTIYVTGQSSSGSGSGVVMTKDGYVLTNNHVVTLDSSTDQVQIQVRTADGTLYDATVVGTDPTSDLAVVKLSNASNLTPATFADSDKVQVGDTAVAIGAPLGLSNTVTDGIISATNRAVQTGSTQDDSTVIDAIQTDAAINPGNSGGALVNAAGEVIGINSAIATVASSSAGGQQSSQSGNIGVGFAIPSDTAKRIADQIVSTGKATHALLGVSAQTAGDANSAVGSGAQLHTVSDGSPAADAGLKVGDVIIAVGDRQITDSTELTAAVRSSDPGDKVTVTYKRGDSTDKVQVTLDSAGD